MERCFVGEQHVLHQRFEIRIELGLSRRSFADRLGDAGFPAGANHQIGHAGLVLQRHQRHDIAQPAEVAAGVEFLRQTGQVLRIVQVQHFRMSRIVPHRVSDMAHAAVRTRDVPSAPAILETECGRR